MKRRPPGADVLVNACISEQKCRYKIVYCIKDIKINTKFELNSQGNRIYSSRCNHIIIFSLPDFKANFGSMFFCLKLLLGRKCTLKNIYVTAHHGFSLNGTNMIP